MPYASPALRSEAIDSEQNQYEGKSITDQKFFMLAKACIQFTKELRWVPR